MLKQSPVLAPLPASVLSNMDIEELAYDSAGSLLRHAATEGSLPESVRAVLRLQKRRIAYRALFLFLKNGAAAYSFKAALSILGTLLARPKRLLRRPRAVLRAAFGVDSLRFGASVGGATGVYNLLLRFLRRFRQKDDYFNTAVAGFVSGLMLRFDTPGRRRTVATYFFCRAIDFLCSALAKREMHLLPEAMRPHVVTALFQIASAVIMYAWHVYPDALPKSYHRWISHKGHIDHRTRQAIEDICQRGGPTKHVDLTSWCQEWNMPRDFSKVEYPRRLPCQVMHPWSPHSCTKGAAMQWFYGIGRALPVYLPVHLLPLLLFRFGKLRSAPIETLRRVTFALVRSSVFLTSFQGFFWFAWCHSRNLLGFDHRYTTAFAGLWAGLSILIEKQSRRRELLLFCMPRVLEAAFSIARKKGMPRVPGGDVLLFGLAMAITMPIFEHDKNADVMGDRYRKILSMLVR
ncbi:MAG: hypothetical protein MHM6MM_001946 [Cercozoa sp. M6MM]